MDSVKELLLIHSFNLEDLIAKYHGFFLSLLPSIFIIAVFIEFLDRSEPFFLLKRVFISILLLTSVSSFYYSSISYSMEAADSVLKSQILQNPFLMDATKAKKHLDSLPTVKSHKEKDLGGRIFSFIKTNLFNSFVNDGFFIFIFFIVKLCFLILKVVYSLVYYLGYGLMGIPCLLYLFPSMGNVLRGALLSYVWCLIVPHILVFMISLISTEINQGYVAGKIIGGSLMGTAMLFIFSLFVAFTPLVTMMLLSGSGMAQAGGIIASLGANYVMSLPRKTFQGLTSLASGSPGPAMKAIKGGVNFSYRLAKSGQMGFSQKQPHPSSDSSSKDHSSNNQTQGDQNYDRKTQRQTQRTQPLQEHRGVNQEHKKAHSSHRYPRNHSSRVHAGNRTKREEKRTH